MPPRDRCRHCLRDERGAALVTIVLVAVLLSFVSVVFVRAVISNFDNIQSARKSGRFTAEADAGIDRTLRELDFMGLTSIAACTDFIPTDDEPDYDANPCTFTDTVTTGAGEERYISVITPTEGKVQFDPPDVTEGFYTITSQVFDSSGDFVRRVEQTVSLSLVDLPIGIFAKGISGGGNPDLLQVTMLSEGDVVGRDKMTFVGEDNFYGGGAGVKATGTIYAKSNGTDPIHESSTIDCEFPYDEDALGGPVPDGSCPSAQYEVPDDSSFTLDDLHEFVDEDAPGLSEDQYQALRQRAITTNTLWQFSGGTHVFQSGDLPSDLPVDSVFYIEFTSGSAASNEVNWKADFGSCGNSNAILVVRNGSLRLNGNLSITGSIFVPDAGSEVRGNGTADVYGTVWANEMGNTGNITFAVPDCWINNIPSLFTSVTPLQWRMVDR